MKRSLVWIGKASLLFLVGVADGLVGRYFNPTARVHALECSEAYSNCIVTVPSGWGEFKGGSEFGLAFEDQTGTLRFMLHPLCGNLNTPTEYNAADLKIFRK